MCANDVGVRRERQTIAGVPRLQVVREGGRTALIVDGVVQSIDADSADRSDYWPAMMPDQRPQSALLLGAGGGTLAALLCRRFGIVRILAIDNDRHVVDVGRCELYLGMPSVDVVLADAFQFVESCRGRFDYIAVDLFRGGERPRQVTSRPFLRELQRILSPGGCVAINLFRDRRLETAVERLSRQFVVSRRLDVGKNVVLHCRARR